MEHGVISRRSGVYSYQGWPTVCKTDKNELFAVYSGMRIAHICPFGKTIMQKSVDGGLTWSLPMIVNDTALDDRDAGILNMGGDDLLVSWFCHPASVYLNEYYGSIKMICSERERPISLGQLETFRHLSEEEAKGGSFVRISLDGGFSFGKTIKVPVSAPHGPNITSEGTLIYLGKELYSDSEKKDVVALYISKDKGFTWERKAYIDIPEGYCLDNFHEPHVVELRSGRLFGAIRAQSCKECRVYEDFTVFTCYSDDGGANWTVPECTYISGSPPHLLLHSSGALILTVGRRKPPYGQRAYVSYDEGKTWSDEYILRDDARDGDLGYPSTAELSDGSLITVYYQKYGQDNKTSIQYTKWSLNLS